MGVLPLSNIVFQDTSKYAVSDIILQILQSGEEIEEEFGLVLLSALSEHAKEETVGFLQPILPVLFLAHASVRVPGEKTKNLGSG
jgi:hypothetical protein